MISRYSRPAMVALWSDETRFGLWLEIETLAIEAMAELGIVPEHAARDVRERGAFDIGRIREEEAAVKHDVIAFLTSVAEHVGESACHMHRGLTSSDVLDTCLALQLTRAADMLIEGVDRVRAALEQRAREHARTLMMGRSHGMHAEPTSLGLKFAGHYAEMTRNRGRLVTARGEVGTCALSGAVGNFANIDPRVEALVARKLDLRCETVSTQVIPRDRQAAFFAALALTASAIERLATEIRHLQRSEIGEAEEHFSTGQKGSSAMPHKRNPVLSENLTGLARLVRSCLTPALENVTLWHERDISHSSVERGIAPDATTHLDFALHRLAGVIENLRIDAGAMQANIDRHKGLHCSQRVLLAMTDAGLAREQAYRLVQACAMRAWEQDRALLECLAEEPGVRAHLDHAQLETLFDPQYYLAHVDFVLERALGSAPEN